MAQAGSCACCLKEAKCNIDTFKLLPARETAATGNAHALIDDHEKRTEFSRPASAVARIDQAPLESSLNV